MTAKGLLVANERLAICLLTVGGEARPTILLILLALVTASAGPAAAATPPGGAPNSTDAILKWINAYRAARA